MAKAYTGRRAARVLIIQGLYAHLLSGLSQMHLEDELLAGTYHQILREFEDLKGSLPCKKVDEPYFRDCFEGCKRRRGELEKLITPLLDRPIHQLGPVEHAILLLGTYELTCRQDVPYKVVINEAIDLGKDFGAQESHKYINGVLDKISQQKARMAETAFA